MEDENSIFIFIVTAIVIAIGAFTVFGPKNTVPPEPIVTLPPTPTVEGCPPGFERWNFGQSWPVQGSSIRIHLVWIEENKAEFLAYDTQTGEQSPSQTVSRDDSLKKTADFGIALYEIVFPKKEVFQISPIPFVCFREVIPEL